MQATVEQLALTTPQVAFNGGLIYKPTDLFPMVLAEISTRNNDCRTTSRCITNRI
mgnify:CR=1 FL=1